MRHVFVGLEIGVRAARAEALDRAHHDARVQLVDLLPGEAEPVEHPGSEILHDDVALPQEVDEHRLAFSALHVDHDRALVAVEHREVQAVCIRHVAQLAARSVALRRLELDHVGTQPCQQLGAGRARLHVGHVEDADSLECFHSDLQKLYFFFPLVGFRLVMRPLSVPAVSSMTALMSVGLRDRTAPSIALPNTSRRLRGLYMSTMLRVKSSALAPSLTRMASGLALMMSRTTASAL